jgi:flagella basal body P-ring formation protein FlgA
MKRLTPYLLSIVLIGTLFFPIPAHAAIDREQEIRSALLAFVMARTSGMGWDVRLKKMTLADATKLPDGTIDYEIVAPQQWEGWGSVNMAVFARQHDKVVRNIPVRLDVEALADTVVTLRQIDHGSIVAETDLVVQKREIAQSSHLAARNLADVVGKKARMTLKANQPVRPDQLEKVPLVTSGQMVTIIAENDMLKISVSGKARSSGAEGDTIKVQNLSSLKEIPARVISATTVQVAF